MPMNLYLNRPILHGVKISGQREERRLEKFTCNELTPGDEEPTADMIKAVIQSTRTEAGDVPTEADLRRLDLQGGISAAVQALFNF
ncbi:MAG: hypothetical protein ACT6Q7_08455 [Blastomonas fulva]|uniref:hypothetical protein n=1 Tax=Blastomonas fulva TaxID=1550728 RepID=UPI0040349A7F